jgi:hypothetical protein
VVLSSTVNRSRQNMSTIIKIDHCTVVVVAVAAVVVVVVLVVVVVVVVVPKPQRDGVRQAPVSELLFLKKSEKKRKKTNFT